MKINTSTHLQSMHAIWHFFTKALRWLLKPIFLSSAKQINAEAELAARLFEGRNRILTYMVRVTSILSVVVLLFLMNEMLARKRWEIVAIYMIVALTIGLISFIPGISYRVRAITFLTIVFLIAIVDLVLFGVVEDWRLYFSAFAILTTIFFGWRAGVAAIFLSLTAFITIAWQIAEKNILVTASTLGSPDVTVTNIVAMSLAFLLTNSIIIATTSSLLHEFERATAKEHKTAVSLRKKTAELEHSLAREQKLARELTATLQSEEALSQLRATIITTVSHEFRTPLTVINNSVTLLTKYFDRLSEEKRRFHYENIHSSIFYLDHLLQDVSLVGRTKEKGISFHPSQIPFSTFCKEISGDLLQQTNHPPNVQIEYKDAPEKILFIDYNLVKRVVSNLLLNALKFSAPDAPISIHIQVDKALTISVADQGIGIPPADREKIWDLFQRGSNVEAKNGLGLGLFIVQQLVDTMSGTISSTNTPQRQGSIFTVQLPILPID